LTAADLLVLPRDDDVRVNVRESALDIARLDRIEHLGAQRTQLVVRRIFGRRRHLGVEGRRG
jgi:hypothetical protein